MSETAVVSTETEGTPSPSPEVEPPVGESSAEIEAPPSYVFFGVTAALSLLADVVTKAWAEIALMDPARSDRSLDVIPDHLSFTLAYNRGGAWGLLQNASELVRRPFFVCVSIAAVVFIYSLYSRLTPSQRALKWGLPLVLGGALGNLADRIIRSSVVDFIDYRADWIRSMNHWVARMFGSWNVTDHWPTFNVADIWICIGVGLMAVDMMTSRRGPPPERISVV
jgi:signal peptidase II